MTTYTLRPATDHDFDFLFGLHQAAMGQYIESIWGWHDDWQREYFRRKFNAPQRQIIQIAGQDAGVLVVEARPDELYLNLIELLPKYQAQGVGSAIVGSLLAQARATGVPLTLHVLKSNEPARRLYERLGLRVVEEEEVRYRLSSRPANRVEELEEMPAVGPPPPGRR